MFRINLKNIFLFIFMSLVAISCDNDDNPASSQEQHLDAEGFVLELNGDEVYREFKGAITNNIALTTNATLELSVHFLDDDGNELEHEDEEGEEDELVYEFLDGDGEVLSSSTIISIMIEAHDDDHGEDVHCEDLTTETECGATAECEWHADDMACEDEAHDDDHAHDDEHHELGFELTGLAAGTEYFRIKLMHGTHADYTSLPISVTVSSATFFSCTSKQLCLKNCCIDKIYASK